MQNCNSIVLCRMDDDTVDSTGISVYRQDKDRNKISCMQKELKHISSWCNDSQRHSQAFKGSSDMASCVDSESIKLVWLAKTSWNDIITGTPTHFFIYTVTFMLTSVHMCTKTCMLVAVLIPVCLCLY